MSSVFTNLILDVGDLERSLAFYRDVLKLPIHHTEDLDGHHLAYLSSGGTDILLLQQPKADQNPVLERRGGLVMKFYVNDIRGLAKGFLQNQVTVLKDLETPSIGERTVLIADPDGYAVLLAEPVETIH